MNNNEYFKVSVKKETVEKVKTTVSGIRDTISANADGFNGTKGGDAVYENDLLVVDQCVVPTEQEIPIRQYNIARLSTPLWKKAYGRLQVTNKRRYLGRHVLQQVKQRIRMELDVFCL